MTEDERAYSFGWEYDASEALERLCDMVRERYPQTPPYDEIEEVPADQISKKLCRMAVCAEYPGIVSYFLIAGIRAGTEDGIAFCVSGAP